MTLRQVAAPHPDLFPARRGEGDLIERGLGLPQLLDASAVDLALDAPRFSPRDGLVAMRLFGTINAWRMRSASRARASSRLRSWVRNRSARMMSTPSSAMRRPASVTRRSRTATARPPGMAHVEAQLDRSRDLVDVLAAGARRADEPLLSSRSSMVSLSVTRMGAGLAEFSGRCSRLAMRYLRLRPATQGVGCSLGPSGRS